MRTISAILSISMDGVIQAPGRSDEDTRGGFDRGGWAVPYNDEVMAQRMAEGMSSSGTMRFAASSLTGMCCSSTPSCLVRVTASSMTADQTKTLKLVDSVVTPKGVIITTYEPARS